MITFQPKGDGAFLALDTDSERILKEISASDPYRGLRQEKVLLHILSCGLQCHASNILAGSLETPRAPIFFVPWAIWRDIQRYAASQGVTVSVQIRKMLNDEHRYVVVEEKAGIYARARSETHLYLRPPCRTKTLPMIYVHERLRLHPWPTQG